MPAATGLEGIPRWGRRSGAQLNNARSRSAGSTSQAAGTAYRRSTGIHNNALAEPRYSAEYYGNWGGQYWSGGKKTEKIAPKDYLMGRGMGTDAPVDSMDEVFKRHDESYYQAGRAYALAWEDATKKHPRSCMERTLMMQKAYSEMRKSMGLADEQLASDLKALGDDPQKWKHPPGSDRGVCSPDITERARMFRRRALVAFTFLSGVSKIERHE